MSHNSSRLIVILAISFAFTAPAFAEEEAPQPVSMNKLLQRVKSGWSEVKAKNKEREARFIAERDKQKALLAALKKEVQQAEARSTSLEQSFQTNEIRIAELEETLKQSMGNMGELFGVIRQVAGDTRGHLDASIASAEFGGRQAVMDKLSESKSIPSIGELRGLWEILLQEMVESGKVSRFDAPVLNSEGIEVTSKVTRVGLFNALLDGQYLQWLPDVQKLTILGRQPGDRFLSTAEDLSASDGNDMVRFAIDPSRGSILSLLVQTPTLGERLEFGGVIGYIILGLGAFTVLIGLFRLVILTKTNGAIAKQITSKEADEKNPLGRILKVYEDNPQADAEALELKLDEAILREQSGVEEFLWAVKVVSVAAPLMGLLGTVTGMINTFQAITLFGTGDPKLMAGGISEALVTTMLGLVVAIPLVLLHSLLKTMCRRIMETIGEQSVGLVAERSENSNA